MKKFVLLFNLILIVFLTGAQVAFAQSFPVQVLPQALPPAPINFSDYADETSISSPLRVQLILNDLQIGSTEVRLKASFEGNGISFESNDFVVGAPSLFLESGIPLNLTNIELAPYFRFENIIGISPNVYGQPIPEGTYRFCFEVFDAFSGNRISDRTCAGTVIFQNDPPILIAPQNKTIVEERNPQNIFFQWTPRHINVSNVEYELSIVEIWDNQVDHQAAFLSSPPIFQVTTTATTYLYGPADPQLLSDKNYAWRVQVKARDGAGEVGLFKNQGFSTIFAFGNTGDCGIPLGVNHEVKGATNANIFWDNINTESFEFQVRYREKGRDNEWFYSKTTANLLTIWDLQAGTEYEYQLSKTCALAESEYSPIQSFRTHLFDDDDSAYECGIAPDIDVTNEIPLANLTTGEKFTAGDFPVTVTEVNGSNGFFNGKGYVTIPYLKSIKVAVEFTNIFINELKELKQGNVQTLYDPSLKGIIDPWDFIDDVGDIINGGDHTDTEPVDFDIDTVVIEGDTIVVTGTDENGNPVEETFPYDEGDTYTVTGENTVYAIDENGNVNELGPVAEGGAVTNANTTGISSGGSGTADDPSVATIADNDVAITYSQDPAAKYGWDEANSPHENGQYPNLETQSGATFYPIHKAVKNGDTDSFFIDIDIKKEGLSIDDLIFKTVATGLEIKTEAAGSNRLKVIVGGSGGYRNEEAVITYKESEEKQVVVSSFFIHHLRPLNEVNVTLIPVGGYTVPGGMTSELKNLFSSAGANLNVQLGNAFNGNTANLQYTESGLLSKHPESFREFYTEFKNNFSGFSSETYYVFLFDQNVQPGQNIAGFMPRGTQFGYVFSANVSTTGLESKQTVADVVAHELGHGVFGISHPGDTTLDTDWLMDQGKGNQLAKRDWEAIGDEGIQLYLFDSDEDGEFAPWEYINEGDFLVSKIPNTNDDDILSFVSPTGLLYSLSGTARDISFQNGFLIAFTIDGERYAATSKGNEDKFYGYYEDDGTFSFKRKDKISKNLGGEIKIIYGFTDKENEDCNSKNSLISANYIGPKVTGNNPGYKDKNQLSLLKSNRFVYEVDLNIVDTSSSVKLADVSDTFNCLKNDDLRFLYKYVQYVHEDKELGFLDDLFTKLNGLKDVYTQGLTSRSVPDPANIEIHTLDLESYGDITLFKNAINTLYDPKLKKDTNNMVLKIVLSDENGNKLFPELLTDIIPFFESIENCITDTKSTIDINSYYVPLCVWKDVEVNTESKYGLTDPAFTSGMADGAVNLIVDLYKLVRGLQKLQLAYGLSLQQCSQNQPNPNEFYIGEYANLINELKAVSVNLGIDLTVGAIPPGLDNAFVSLLKKHQDALEAIKTKSDLGDKSVRNIAKVLTKVQEFTPQKFKDWKDNVRQYESFMLDLKNQNITCDEGQKVRDQMIGVLNFMEQLTHPTKSQARKQVLEQLGNSFNEYLDKSASTDNVARYTHGRLAFAIVSELAIASFTAGGGNIATSTTRILAKTENLATKVSGLAQIAAKQAANGTKSIFVNGKRIFSRDQSTLLMVVEDDGTFKLYKVLNDNNASIQTVPNSRFDDIDIELPNGQRLDNQDFDLVESDGQTFIRLLDNSYVPAISMTRLADDVAASIRINWKNINQTEIWFDNTGNAFATSAKKFAEETSRTSKKVDLIINDNIYVKMDLEDGRILLGDTDGNYHAFGQINPDEFNAKKALLSNDAELQKYLELKSEQLLVLSGVTPKALTSLGRLSTTKVNTILGRFNPHIKDLFDELGSFKNIGLGETPGGINLLNRPDGLYNPSTWWDEFNKPWLDKAIERGDKIILATIPARNADLIDDAGNLKGAFAQEVKHLVDNDITPSGDIPPGKWDEIKGWFKNSGRKFTTSELALLKRADLPEFVSNNLDDLLLGENRAAIWNLNNVSSGQFKRGDLIEEIFNQWGNKYGGYQNLNDIIPNYRTLDFDGVLANVDEVVSLKSFKPISNNTLSNFKSTVRSNMKKLNDDVAIGTNHSGKLRVLDFTIEKGAWSQAQIDEVYDYIDDLLNSPTFRNVSEVRITEF